MRPIVLQVPESDEAVIEAMNESVQPPPAVHAIMRGGRTSLAVIDGTLSQVGTRVGGYVVTHIDAHSVRMNGPGGVINVGLRAASQSPDANEGEKE